MLCTVLVIWMLNGDGECHRGFLGEHYRQGPGEVQQVLDDGVDWAT